MQFQALVLFATCVIASRTASQDPPVLGPLRCAMKRDYWLQRPSGFDVSRMHWLVVLAHGFRAEGKDILWLRRSLAQFDDCIVVPPSFPEGFQLLEARADQQLIGLFASLKKKYRLHDKMFVCGFSAGAQFSHRFTMKHPRLVIGCSAHSGGTWGPIANVDARHIPMTLSCGLDDTELSSLGQPLSRAQAAHRYFDLLARKGFHVKARLWHGVGHATSPATEASIAECYLLSTRGLYLRQTKELERRVAAIRRGVADRPTAARNAGFTLLCGVPETSAEPARTVAVTGSTMARRTKLAGVSTNRHSNSGVDPSSSISPESGIGSATENDPRRRCYRASGIHRHSTYHAQWRYDVWPIAPGGGTHTATRNMKKIRIAERTFHVNVPDGSGYDVVHRPGLLPDYGLLCRDIIPDLESKLIVLTDDRVDRLYGDQLRESFQRANLSPEFICIAPGETSKSLKTFEELLEDLAARRMDRRGLLVNFGGGVICDLGGFVASSYMRGIAYANFSTSLIGQLDASIGGKVAVNTTRAKNLIGAFHHPLHVAGDACVLETLSKRDLRSGIAEAIKVGIIASPELFELLESNPTALRAADPEVATDVVGLASSVKMDLVTRDPYEDDLRRPLNLGHTLGHPIETEFSYEKVRHGEAVAIGMGVATTIGLQKSVITMSDADRIFDVLAAYELIGCVPPMSAESIVDHLRYVKLIRGNRLHFVLPRGIGDVLVTEEISTGDLLRGFAQYDELCVAHGCQEHS